MTSAATAARPALDAPEPGRLTIQYAPEDGTATRENPPRFTWLPVIEDEARYPLRLSRDPAFPDEGTRVYADLPLNIFTPPDVLEPGAWHWSYATWDELMYRQMFPAVEPTPPSEGGRLRHFGGVGWVGIQHAMERPDEHVQIVMKSSPFGSVSHSHGDQNAFCLAAHGEDVAIQSGHYVAFNSSMHRDWRRQTRSKNAILIDGEGQYAGRDKARAMASRGRIAEVREADDHVFVRGDATDAYRSLSPDVTSVTRDLYFVHDTFLVIVDSIDAERPVTIDWLLHANAPMRLGATTFRYEGERAGFYGKVLWSEAGAPRLAQETGYPGVDPADHEGLPVSTCLTARYPRSRRHRIATMLVPYPADEPRRVYSFLDDQGYDCDLYFTNARDRSFKVAVSKTFDPATLDPATLDPGTPPAKTKETA